MWPIDNLEIHVAHSCNLACEGCSHYSNHGHKGLLSLEEADRWMGLWDRRLKPRIVSLLGGEPTIHPQLSEMVLLTRRHWPTSNIRLVTNGFLLHRHPDLPKALKAVGNARLRLSVHHVSDDYLEKLRPVIQLMQEWERTYGIEMQLAESYKDWRRQYKGFGAEMEPYEDGQPRVSWENCKAVGCWQLHEASIWKCAPLAYLPMQDAKYGLSEKWRPYLEYKPLSAACSDEELQQFFLTEDEPFCGMCPSHPTRFHLPDPTVRPAMQ